MTGSQLVKHSFGMIKRNIGTAIRISLALFLVSLALQFGFSLWMSTNAGAIAGRGTAAFLLMSYIPSIITLLLGAWMAVAWHRFVLLEEESGGWLPNFHGREVMHYILWIIVLGLIYLLMILPVVIIMIPAIDGVESGDAVNAGMVAMIFLGIILTMLVVVVVLSRFSPVLVARAVSKRLSLSDAWRATRGSTKPIIGFMLIMFLFLIAFGVVVSLVVMALQTASFVLIVPIYLALAWFLMLLQISFMTTLYGCYVEGRELTV